MAETTFHSIKLPGIDAARAPEQAAEFNTGTAYAVKDYCTYQGVLYRCTTAHAAGAWNASHFTATNLDNEFDRKLDIPASSASAPANPRVGDLWIDNDEDSTIYNVDAQPTSGSTNAVQSGGTYMALNGLETRKANRSLFSGDYSASATYEVNQLVMNGAQLYRCKTRISTPEAWNASHWQATNLNTEFNRLRDSEADTDMIAETFGTSSSYAVGDYVVYNSNLYRCKSAVSDTGSWDPNDWVQVALTDDVSDLKKTLSISALSWTTGYAIKTNTSTVDLTPVENSSWDYMLINCNEGDTFMINAVGGGDYRLWCFIDEYNSRLTVADANADAEHSDLIITAPAKAVKCIINSFSWKHADTSYKIGVFSTINNAVIQVTGIKNTIQNDETLTEIKQTSFTSGANIKLGTTIGGTVNLTPDTSATNWSYSIINCVEGDAFIISGYGSGNSMPYGFIDKDNKLLSLSPSSTLTNQIVIAPENTAKIVINSLTKSIHRGENKYILKDVAHLENEIDSLEDRIDFTDNMCLVDVIPYEAGYNYTVYNSPYYTVSVSKHADANWKSCVLECAEGAKFIVSGYGTENTPVYAFIDAANRLLNRSQSSTLNGVEIVAPAGTARLILNTVASALDNKVVPKYNKYSAYVKSYDYIKGENVLSNPSADNVLYAYCNGIKFSEEIMTPVIDFNKTGDLFMHVPTFKIIDGVVYATYYVNTRSVNERPSEMTARFAYASMSDPTNITYIDLQDIGETFDGKTVTAIYDTILMAIDSNVLYLMWTAKLNDEYCRLYKTYTISTGVMSSTQYNTFTVNGNTANFTVGNMETLFENAGITYKPMTLDIGIMQKITSHVDSGTTYYYTGCYNQQFNCIIKSSDLINWIYVTQPTFECLANYENAVYVSGDYCYYFLRLLSQYSYGLLARYDIANDIWGYPVQVPDCQSRSDFFEVDGTLYLVHAPQDRDHISIMLIKKNDLNKSFEVQTAGIDFGFYPYVDGYNNELYIAFCWKYKHIYVSKFTLLPYSKSDIAQKITALLED